MGIVVKEGDYAKMGAVPKGNSVIFTFAGEKEDTCAIVLVEQQTKKELEIEVPDSYCLGSLRSIQVTGFNYKDYDYYFRINGEEQIDPYAQVIRGRELWNDVDRVKQNYKVYGGFSSDKFDWTDDMQPEIPKSQMIMYKLHVRGFSMDRPRKGRSMGTFSGVSEKVEYLKSLGVTTVELMPVYEFDEIQVPVKEPVPEYVRWETKKGDIIQPPAEEEKIRLNYWGYGPGNYFAVKASYAKKPSMAANEFKQLVRTLHRNQMECVMEIYFPEDVNHNLILDALRYWVREFHVDGFHLLGENLPVTAIVQDVLLSRTKIFYTYFDQNIQREDKKYKNLYIYKEEYQYPARKILNHINGDMKDFIDQQRKQQKSFGYVNFISSNNGFTLADIFMYNDRHNEANGEDNLDGTAWNFSSNYGVEGPTRKKYIVASRSRQWRNAILMLFMAQGVPMIWSGDEMCNSQSGNNNAYCQDNEIGWLNWKNLRTHTREVNFLKKVTKFRKEHPLIAQVEPFHFNDYKTYGFPDVSYHGESAWISNFDLGRMSLGMLYCGAYSQNENKEDIYIAYNFFSAESVLALPKLAKRRKWYMAIDSTQEEVSLEEEPQLLKGQKYLAMEPQSICVLIGK